MSQKDKTIGIDIGGTKIAVAAVDAFGRICSRVSLTTQSERGFDVGLAEIIGAIRKAIEQAGWRSEALRGIGIGCAGPVNPARGTIHNPYTLPGWDGADIVTPLREAFEATVRLENDADAAAMGEFYFGAGGGASPLVMITLGTGIGGAMLVDGVIHRGVQAEHPELGHIPIDTSGPECYCGTRGCWESLASGTAIGAAGLPFGFSDSRAVFAAASKDPKAAAIIERAVQATGRATWTLLHACLPQRIVLGGGLSEEHFDQFAGAMREQVLRATQIPAGAVEIVPARLGNDAGVIGAASLVFPTMSRTPALPVSA